MFFAEFHKSMRLKSCLTATAIGLHALSAQGAWAGPVTGGASEWTQLMNNAELVTLVSKETQNVALNSARSKSVHGRHDVMISQNTTRANTVIAMTTVSLDGPRAGGYSSRCTSSASAGDA